MKADITTEVLIIGGGPAGMLSGIYLDRLGISSIVLERQYEISPHPKAHELSARSIEILCQLGFTIEELKAEASSYRDASRVLFGHTINHELGEIDLLEGGNDQKYKAHLASPDPYLNLSQTALEKIMRSHLLSCSKSQLLVGHQWESMEEHEQGMLSWVLDRKREKQYTIQSKYVLCADGAGSRSRKALSIDMLGAEKINDFISVYFEMNLRDFLKKTAKLFWIMNPAAPGTFIAHHIEKRWVYHFPIFTPHEKRAQYTEAILKERILTALGDKNLPLELTSISLWRMTCQIAQTFRKGRAFLVGDAAHRFPPTGGLGMNSGIGDVQNLCWKLAWVLKGIAGDSLLDSYESERRSVIELNSKESLRNYFKIWEVPQSMGLNPHGMKWQAIIVNRLLLKLFPQKWVHAWLQRIFKILSKKILAITSNRQKHLKVQVVIKDQIEHFDRIGLDLGYSYAQGAIVRNESEKLPVQAVSTYQPSIVPGVRFPHFWIQEEGIKRSSHEWLDPKKFTLLCNDKGEAWWSTASARLRPEILSVIQPINISTSMQNQPNAAPEKAWYPFERVPLLLIRPDGQVAWKPETLDINLEAVFRTLISTHEP